jgi:hypothetical protein
MRKIEPMANKKQPDLSKKGQHTFNQHLHLEDNCKLKRKQARKNKRKELLTAWID